MFVSIPIIGTITWLAIFEHNYHPPIYRYSEEVTILRVGERAGLHSCAGSVKPDNVDDLMREPDIDGTLVGGASLKAESFARIVRFEG